jgi:hypothetical protein
MIKMTFALSMSDIGLWLAVTAIILIITSELIYSLPGLSGRIIVDRNRFRLAAFGCGIAFLLTVVLRLVAPF